MHLRIRDGSFIDLVVVDPVRLPLHIAAGMWHRCAVARSYQAATFRWIAAGTPLAFTSPDMTVSSTATSDVTRAELALALAGRALDPNGEQKPGGDPVLASELLARAMGVAASALGVTRGGGVSEQVELIDESVLTRAAGSRERAVELATRVTSAEVADLGVAELREAELFTTKLIQIAKDRRRFDKGVRRWRIVKLVAAVVVLVVGSYGLYFMFRHQPTWKASSAYTGYHLAGELPRETKYDTFFHTNEEANPWVEIDLGHERDVSRVIVTNRFDCCFDRAIPLIVQVRGDRGMFREVARRTTSFNKWSAVFPTEKARYIRLTLPNKGVLHLRNVEVP